MTIAVSFRSEYIKSAQIDKEPLISQEIVVQWLFFNCHPEVTFKEVLKEVLLGMDLLLFHSHQ